MALHLERDLGCDIIYQISSRGISTGIYFKIKKSPKFLYLINKCIDLLQIFCLKWQSWSISIINVIVIKLIFDFCGLYIYICIETSTLICLFHLIIFLKETFFESPISYFSTKYVPKFLLEWHHWQFYIYIS